jgi:hypothetical protein
LATVRLHFCDCFSPMTSADHRLLACASDILVLYSILHVYFSVCDVLMAFIIIFIIIVCAPSLRHSTVHAWGTVDCGGPSYWRIIPMNRPFCAVDQLRLVWYGGRGSGGTKQIGMIAMCLDVYPLPPSPVAADPTSPPAAVTHVMWMHLDVGVKYLDWLRPVASASSPTVLYTTRRQRGLVVQSDLLFISRTDETVLIIAIYSKYVTLCS